MKTPSYLALVFLMVVAVGASLAVLVRSGSRPSQPSFSFSEMPAGVGDPWDETVCDTPPLAPGAAARIARERIRWVRSPDDTGGWMLDGLTLQRVCSSYDVREWVYVVHFNACFAAGSGKAPAVLRVPVQFDGSVPPGAIDPALFCPVAQTLGREASAAPGSIIRQ